MSQLRGLLKIISFISMFIKFDLTNENPIKLRLNCEPPRLLGTKITKRLRPPLYFPLHCSEGKKF